MTTATDLHPTFDGPHIDQTDAPRLRLQLQLVRTAMLDGRWRTPDEVRRSPSKLIACGTASITARLRDLRKSKFGGYTVECQRRVGTRGAYEYRLIPHATIPAELAGS